MVAVLLAPLIIGLILALFAPYFLNTSSEIDSCLDSGGSYNYDECSCDHKATHPFKAQHEC